MDSLLNLLAVYTAIFLLAIFVGANLTRWLSLTHTRTQLMMSFVSGLMLGVAIFHLLPHAIYSLSGPMAVELAARWTMVGLLTMFLLLRVFDFHHHDIADGSDDVHCHAHGESSLPSPNRRWNWLGIALGLVLHTLVDGVALAASMQADWLLRADNSWPAVFGVGVFLAILLHKPLDAITLTALMQRAGVSQRSRRLMLLVFALLCPASAAIFLWSFDSALLSQGHYVGAALAFSAGVFLCISLSDLLPELHFHRHDRGLMTVVLLLGVALALAISLVEPAHRHSFEPVATHMPH